MFCGNCGKEKPEDSSICPECGFNCERELVFEETESKEFHFVGVRGRAGGVGIREVCTDLKIDENGKISVFRSRDFSSGNSFYRRDVTGIDLTVLPVWGVFDWIGIILFSLLIPFTYGLSFLFVLFSIKLTLSRQIRIRLNSGKAIKIPICQKADASQFFREFNYSKDEIQKNDDNFIGEHEWLRRKKWATNIFFFIAISLTALGFYMFSGSMQETRSNEYIQIVKEWSQKSYPDQTYGEAFEAFFEAPKWEYFKGTLDGDDKEYNIVEFTGYWVAVGEKVFVRMQFNVNGADDTIQSCSLFLDGIVQEDPTVMMTLMDMVFNREQ